MTRKHISTVSRTSVVPTPLTRYGAGYEMNMTPVSPTLEESTSQGYGTSGDLSSVRRKKGPDPEGGDSYRRGEHTGDATSDLLWWRWWLTPGLRRNLGAR